MKALNQLLILNSSFLIPMYYPVVQFGEFGLVPTVGGSYQVAGDALQFVDVGAAAFRTNFQVGGGVFVSAFQAAVAVVVHRAVTDVVPVHHIYYTHDDFGVVGGVAVNLHVEDVSAAGQVVVGGFYFRFMAGAALVVHGHVVGVGVVVAVCDAR